MTGGFGQPGPIPWHIRRRVSDPRPTGTRTARHSDRPREAARTATAHGNGNQQEKLLQLCEKPGLPNPLFRQRRQQSGSNRSRSNEREGTTRFQSRVDARPTNESIRYRRGNELQLGPFLSRGLPRPAPGRRARTSRTPRCTWRRSTRSSLFRELLGYFIGAHSTAAGRLPPSLAPSRHQPSSQDGFARLSPHGPVPRPTGASRGCADQCSADRYPEMLLLANVIADLAPAQRIAEGAVMGERERALVFTAGPVMGISHVPSGLRGP